MTVNLEERDHAGVLLDALHAQRLASEALERMTSRVAVSGEGGRLFLYADSEGAAHAASDAVASMLAIRGLHADLALDRWHPTAEEWKDAGVPLPKSAAELQAEREEREQQEKLDSQATGVAEWELRVELASHADAVTLANRLDAEGLAHVVRRWRYLLVGAANEDEALALQQRVEPLLPAGAALQVEPGSGVTWRSNPFAVFGGLAG